MRRHRFLIFLAAVFAAKLVVVLQLRDHALLQPGTAIDTSAYARLAAEVDAGNRWLSPGLYVVPPLYVYFLAGILAIAKSLIAARIAQIGLGTAAVALVFAAARRWFGVRAAWIAALFAGLTGLFTFYEALLVHASLRFSRPPRWPRSRSRRGPARRPRRKRCCRRAGGLRSPGSRSVS